MDNYIWINVESITGTYGTTSEQSKEAFLFSAQTITTLNYARLAPLGLAVNIVATIESMFHVGLVVLCPSYRFAL
ncbi:hypothetical protein [Nonlabens sp.]|uniref:hypothetical protein n=1 Tax=Nonlabens sp. TaxID=1888209 RepID=UPI001BCBD553|nr:hypothetical protein [Nonlabens sp.]